MEINDNNNQYDLNTDNKILPNDEMIYDAETETSAEKSDDFGFIGVATDPFENDELDSELFSVAKSGSGEGLSEEYAADRNDADASETSPKAEEVKETSGKTGGISLRTGKKLILILAAISGLVALIAIGVGIFGAVNGSSSVLSEEDRFEFAGGTKVSGLDISGMKIKEAKEYLEQNKSSYVTPFKLSVAVGEKNILLTQDNFDYNTNIDEVLSEIKADDEAGNLTSAREYSITATLNEESIDANANEISEANSTDPVDARVKAFHPFEDERFEYSEEKNGSVVDNDDLKQQMTQFFAGGQSSGSIEAVVTEIEPDVTVDFLKENIVELSSYETVSGNTDDATTNMKISLEACNGSVIEPGEDWSFNARTGDSNLESNGYKVGNVISDNQITDGIGGGLCQSSSTIYVAALYSNMAVVQRHPHKWASLYVATGFDATIDYPDLDLVLKNISDYQMFLECRVVDKTLHATFWGVHSSDYDYISLGNELLSSDESGYSVKTWREFYKDGEKAWQEELPESHYDPENGEQFISA